MAPTQPLPTKRVRIREMRKLAWNRLPSGLGSCLSTGLSQTAQRTSGLPVSKSSNRKQTTYHLLEQGHLRGNYLHWQYFHLRRQKAKAYQFSTSLGQSLSCKNCVFSSTRCQPLLIRKNPQSTIKLLSGISPDSHHSGSQAHAPSTRRCRAPCLCVC